MKHRRGIDLTSGVDVGYTVGTGSRRSDVDLYDTLDRFPEWYVLLGWCQRCRRYGPIERGDVHRILGAAARLVDIAPKLLCTGCRQRRGNKLSIRKLPR